MSGLEILTLHDERELGRLQVYVEELRQELNVRLVVVGVGS
ncbi:MAG: hypothetical protein ACRDVZ_02330 [Jiangellaceae bacterium]